MLLRPRVATERAQRGGGQGWNSALLNCLCCDLGGRHGLPRFLLERSEELLGVLGSLDVRVDQPSRKAVAGLRRCR